MTYVKGMGAFLEGPFFSHTAGYAPAQMHEAIEHLEVTIEELGPFDGVLGFSQGAALALSFLHLRQSRGEPAPFRFALCFSSVIPCSADSTYCQDIIRRLCSRGQDFISAADTESLLQPDERVFREILLKTVVPAKKNRGMLPDYDMAVYMDGTDGSLAPRVMHPQLQRERITIPTIHVRGRRDADFMQNMAEAARGLCDERLMKKTEHSGGHQPPQKDAEVKAAVRAMEWAISQSQQSNLRL